MTGRHKFGNIKTTVDGIEFASKREARRYQELRLLERAGEIADLQLQPKFPLEVNGQKIGSYIADFSYHPTFRGATMAQLVVEDAKGVRTPVYNIKKKLVRALHGVDVVEV